MSETTASRKPVSDAADGRAAARPRSRARVIAFCCIGALSLTGWLYAGLMIVPEIEAGHVQALGPGMGVFDWIAQPGTRAAAWLRAICGAPFVTAGAASSWTEAALVFAMWSAMTLAMMLPTAAPMLATYLDLAETAAGKGEGVPSPLILAAGYACVWLGFAGAAAFATVLLTSNGSIAAHVTPVGPWLGGVIFLNAGLYQFSSLKQACLRACQRPFPFFFANWTTRPGGIFALGVRQGLLCLGCCWAGMLVMFAVGLMNVVWMAGLGIVMTTEKMLTTGRFSRVVGVAFVLIGVAMMASAAVGRLNG